MESHRRAGSAIDQGFFKAQIVPIEIKVKRDKVPFVTDETVRHGTTVEKLAKLPTVFDPEGSVTAGNASGINDAAAAVVLADGEYANKRGLKPIGRLIGYAYAGVDPKYMGIGPVPAVQKLLKKTGFGIDDIDVSTGALTSTTRESRANSIRPSCNFDMSWSSFVLQRGKKSPGCRASGGRDWRFSA